MEESWKELVQQLLYEMNPQDNWHGSSRIFDKFDDSKIKSGSGLSLHGRGHNTTPVKDWAKTFGTKLYRVDIPNENYFYKTYDSFTRDNPINYKPIKQSKFVLNNLKQSPKNIDYFNMLPLGDAERISDIAIDLPTPRYGESKAVDKIFSNIYKTIDSGKEIKPWQKDLFNRIMNKSGLDTKVIYLDKTNNNHLLKQIVGNIKGISSYDEFETPINLVFSGSDIKMANTPIQRFTNRIPTQTLGKMASKLYNTPGIKQAIGISNRLAPPLMILEGLSQPAGEGSDIVPQYPINNTLYGYIDNY